MYVLTTDAKLLALQRFDGRVRWTLPLQRFENEETKLGPLNWSGPVLAGGRLLVVGAHGEMLSISPKDGNIVTRQTIPEGVYEAPVVADGKLFLATERARLQVLYYALWH